MSLLHDSIDGKPAGRTRRSSDRGIGEMIVRRYVIARLYVALSILMSVFSIIYEPISIHSQAMSSAKLPDFLFFSAIVVCIVALADIFVNDFLPNKYKFKHAYEYRHIVYMFLALISFSLSAGLLITYGGSILVGRLWLDGLVAALVAMLDIFARHREHSWRSSTH